MDDPKILVSKLDAARRQLQTAIRLWFSGGDAVSIHTLAYAAYEIVHVVSKKRNRTRDLIFDSLVIKDEARADFNKRLKRDGNFFKHAREDADAVLEFYPAASELFIFFSIVGIEACGERLHPEESGYIAWMSLHHPELLTEAGKKQFTNHAMIKAMASIKSIKKSEFLGAWIDSRRLLGLS